MKLTVNHLSQAIACMGLLTLYGCGGGSSAVTLVAPTTPTPSTAAPEPTTPAVVTTLAGTAAIGAPISGSVFAIDVNGKMSPAATTSALGAFIVNVEGMTAPFILSVTGTAGGKQVSLNSLATAVGQTVNITPLTDLIVSTASGQPGGKALTTLCAPVANVVPAACLTTLKSAADSTKLASATKAVIEMIAPLNPKAIDPLRDTFVADGTGMDAVLDQILVAPATALGDTATVTLIATGKPLGTSVLPSTAGETSVTKNTAPTESDLSKASTAATVLPEVRACLDSLNALYPSTGFTPPSKAAVTPFIDSTFSMGKGFDQQTIISALADTKKIAKPGFTIKAIGFAPFDMSPLTTEEIETLTSSTSTSNTRVSDFIVNRRATEKNAIAFSNGSATSAWVQLVFNGNDIANWKLIKTADKTGCAGGWKLAGSGILSMHMNSRIQRNIDIHGAASFNRGWAFHVQKDDVLAENSTANKIDVRGPGLTDFGDFTKGVTTGKKLQLMMSKTVSVSMSFDNSDGKGTGSSFYGNAEALQSCQDLSSISPTPGNLSELTPCIDERKAGPGSVFVWTLKASGTPLSSFPFQINSVPLSKAFAIANEGSLFATLTSTDPSSLTGLNALAGKSLNGLITYNYAISNTYGAKMDHCGMYLWQNNAQVLSAEQNAVGKETSCTFRKDEFNSLASSTGEFMFTGDLTSAYLSTNASVLGNSAGSTQAISGSK